MFCPVSVNGPSVDFDLTPEAQQELENNKAKNEAWKQKVARITQEHAGQSAPGTLLQACLSLSQSPCCV
jgi:hypothetical protein